MRPRYLLVASNNCGELTQKSAPVFLPVGFRKAFSGPGLSAFVNGGCGCLAVGDKGLILGTLFRREGELRRLVSLPASEAQGVAESGGADLISNFWGGYVAAFCGDHRLRVIRDPSGALACYFVQGDGFFAFASDAELLVEAGLAEVEIDWGGLAAHLYAAGLPAFATALRGIDELLAGFAIELCGRSFGQAQFWSPWDHVAQVNHEDEEEAAERLRSTVRRCVSAWGSGYQRLLVSCSGGLDSSIVAASLAASLAESTCLTIYGDEPESDERTFARSLAKHLGLPLVERRYRIEDIDLAVPLAPHLPRPSDRSHALSYERAHLEVALETGADAFVTGNGGDSVFGYSQSASAIADRYLCQGLGRGLLATIRDVCIQTGCSVSKAALNAARIARQERSYRWRRDGRFLDPKVFQALDPDLLAHPWLDAPANALPGKSAHIASILRVLQCLEPLRGRVLPVLNPLMSQPVIEACLSIPSWAWRTGGQDRSLARRAFRSDLPAAIVRRHVKGGPDGFTARVVDGFRGEIRQRLLDGHLAREKIVDLKAIALELDHGCSGGGERARILELVATEAWIESWLGLRRRPSAGQGRPPIDCRNLSQ